MGTLLTGKFVKVTKDANGKVTVGDAGSMVNTADLVAGNGVVHSVDKVLAIPDEKPSCPPKIPPTVVDIVTGSAQHTALKEAVGNNELVDALKKTGPFTVFAPDDDAGWPTDLSKSDELTDILLYHVINGRVKSDQLKDCQVVETLLTGKFVKVTKDANGKVTVGDAGSMVNAADLVAGNGVVHSVDKVLAIPDEKPSCEKPTTATVEVDSAANLSVVTTALFFGVFVLGRH